MESKAFNMDCMDGMKQCPDKYFDLAVVDPPYGGGTERERERESCAAGAVNGADGQGHASAGGLTATISTTRTGGKWAKVYQRERRGRRRPT